MDRPSRRIQPYLSVAIAAALFAAPLTAAPPPKGGTTHPAPKVWPCIGQTTRPADHTITMVANQQDYIATVTAAPVTTPPQMESGAMTVAEAKAAGCTRRVIEVKVPSTASSGCRSGECYPNAEINVCAGTFSGSTLWEHHCRVPKSSTSEADCKTFRHDIEVFKKAAGQAEFGKDPIARFTYRGKIESGTCRVVATHLTDTHYDTAEVYPNVVPPTSGTDVYRVTSLPKYKGSVLGTVIFIEFEKTSR
jgi:hypothetical protein